MAFLTLTIDDAIASGQSRLVFAHPRRPDRIVKVMTERAANRAEASRRRYSLSGQYRANKVFAKELTYFLAIQARQPELLRLFPWIHGLVETTLGLGLVYEKITDENGALAPSLAALSAADAIGERHRVLAADLCRQIEQSHVVFHDLQPANIVAAGPAERPERLVIVDGFGDPGVPPLRRLFPLYNRLSQRRGLGVLRAALGLPA